MLESKSEPVLSTPPLLPDDSVPDCSPPNQQQNRGILSRQNPKLESLHRGPGELGEPPIGEVYLRSDPPKMCSVIQKVGKTCLAFKILAAGRTCNKPEQVREIFQSVFSHIKSTDAVIVGMYPRYTDQITENAELTRTFG